MNFAWTEKKIGRLATFAEKREAFVAPGNMRRRRKIFVCGVLVRRTDNRTNQFKYIWTSNKPGLQTESTYNGNTQEQPHLSKSRSARTAHALKFTCLLRTSKVSTSRAADPGATMDCLCI